MRKFLGASVAVVILAVLIGVAVAHMRGGPWRGMRGGMGHRFSMTATQITDEKAKELAERYADKYLAGFKVERILPSTGMPHTMYSVELKNAKGELRSIHITPFGGVMPFSGPAAQS